MQAFVTRPNIVTLHDRTTSETWPLQ